MTEHIPDLRAYLNILRQESELHVIEEEVDPYLEIAEIHRRVIARQGPALLFTKVKGSRFPVVTNLFGSNKRLELAFGRRPQKFVQGLVHTIESFGPPSLGRLWDSRHIIKQAMKIGLKNVRRAPILEHRQQPPHLNDLPLLTSWDTDGGPFVTLPLVYTEHPDGRGHNLGMYRIQRYDDQTTGIHWQIHKGGGFHYHEAEKRNESLPMTLFIGGPPALMMAAIAPLPENIPELLLASLLLGSKLPVTAGPEGGHQLIAKAEFAIQGQVPPRLRRPEGPFGDHYGYDSLRHDYPVFQARTLYYRKDAIYPATVVGRPRQEDYYIGDFLQDLLSPLFPLVMNGVQELKTFGDTGFHCLAAARVCNRYPREAFAAALRILGEGQLSLTKFLIITDGSININDFPALWHHVLERINWQTDLFVFSNVSQDTLDYTGPQVNKGSKAIMMGLGREKCRQLPEEINFPLPPEIKRAEVFLPGTLVVEGAAYEGNNELINALTAYPAWGEWPVIILVDNVREACADLSAFLWHFFTRFEPAADIHGAATTVRRFHVGLDAPIIFDCRLKPWYPRVLTVDHATKDLVDKRIQRLLPAKWR
ncbi:MAG TPA: UbiD family decarboxylase [Desulfobacterales bacterium]|nr:UbiD family decarboxylase [Desulfobacterales bacterium]